MGFSLMNFHIKLYCPSTSPFRDLSFCHLTDWKLLSAFLYRQGNVKIWIPESSKCLLGESGILGIEPKESGIPLTIRIPNSWPRI